MKEPQKSKSVSAELKGWHDIATFLGQPIAVAQRWARSEGMPVEHKGRYVYASPEQLNRWLGREAAGEPVQIATNDSDLSAELKRGLSFVRNKKRSRATKHAA